MINEIRQIACSPHAGEFMAYPFGVFDGRKYLPGGFALTCEEAVYNLVDILDRDTTFWKLGNCVEIVHL